MSDIRLYRVMRDLEGKHCGNEYLGNLVTCEECKYEPICSHSVQHTTRDAHSVTIGHKTVEWCSYGERREP